jgi:Di- and tricarboxylate transporters
MGAKNLVQLIVVILGVFLSFGTKYISPPAGLSQSGFEVVGILIASLLMWLVINIEWPSLFILFALMTIPELGVKTIAASSFGNTLVVFFITCFILASSLITTGVAKRIAVWCVTNNLSRKDPWLNVLMLFGGAFLLGLGLTAPGVLVIYFPIIYEVIEMAKYEKGEEVPKMLVLGTAIVTQTAMTVAPICHAVALQGMAMYNAYTGNTISVGTFAMIGLPTGVGIFALFYLICRFIWKPDLSKLKNVDHEAIKAKLGPMKLEEKIAVCAYLLVIIFWLLPGLIEYFPKLAFMKQVENTFPPIIAISLLCMIRINGKPVLDYDRAVKQEIPWKIIIFMAAIQAESLALADKKIGFPQWAESVLTPMFVNISPLAFEVLLIGFALIMTQFISNGITLAVIGSIGLPLALTIYHGQVNPLILTILLIGASNCAFATPAATHAMALTSATGWVDTKKMAQYGSYAAIAAMLTYCILGISLGDLLFGI